MNNSNSKPMYRNPKLKAGSKKPTPKAPANTSSTPKKEACCPTCGK